MLRVVVALFVLLPASALASANEFRVDREVVNVRSGPGTSHSAIAQAQKGERGWIADRENGWAKVHFYDREVPGGWIREDLLETWRQEPRSTSSSYGGTGVGAEFAIYVVLAAMLYLLPWGVAAGRGHKNTAAIAGLNILLGWTFLGWAVAMVWALTSHTNDPGSPGPEWPTQA